jgi:hypothetical protein
MKSITADILSGTEIARTQDAKDRNEAVKTIGYSQSGLDITASVAQRDFEEMQSMSSAQELREVVEAVREYNEEMIKSGAREADQVKLTINVKKSYVYLPAKDGQSVNTAKVEKNEALPKAK